MVNLKQVDLTRSQNLKKLPNLSKATNLEVLLLRRSCLLTGVHPSIFSLPKLVNDDNCDSYSKCLRVSRK